MQRVLSDKAFGSSQVPQSVHHALKLSGQPLDAATAAFMGSRFGHDFRHVRVHTDSLASDSAKAVGARAYTVGGDIVLRKDNLLQGPQMDKSCWRTNWRTSYSRVREERLSRKESPVPQMTGERGRPHIRSSPARGCLSFLRGFCRTKRASRDAAAYSREQSGLRFHRASAPPKWRPD